MNKPILFGIFEMSTDTKIPLSQGDFCLMNYPFIESNVTIFSFRQIPSGIKLSAKYQIGKVTSISYEDDIRQNMIISTKDHQYMIRKFLHIDFSDQPNYDSSACDILRCVLG